MKNIQLICIALLLVTGFYSCEKTDDTTNTNTALCTDGKRNGSETEIDCGGACHLGCLDALATNHRMEKCDY